jgi:hypothetical protein
MFPMTRRCTRAALAAVLLIGGAGAAQADRIKNPTAVFSGLDKITGRIVSFEVAVDETVQFGALQMTPRVCYTRPPTENPNTTSFVEVDEVTLEAKSKRVFTGWMFAASPGLHGIEHPVYDIWLVDCKGGTEVIAEPKEPVEQPAPPPLRRAGDSRPGDIIAGPDAVPPRIDPAPRPAAVAPEQPARRVLQPNPGFQRPAIDTYRTNDR